MWHVSQCRVRETSRKGFFLFHASLHLGICMAALRDVSACACSSEEPSVETHGYQRSASKPSILLSCTFASHRPACLECICTENNMTQHLSVSSASPAINETLLEDFSLPAVLYHCSQRPWSTCSDRYGFQQQPPFCSLDLLLISPMHTHTHTCARTDTITLIRGH